MAQDSKSRKLDQYIVRFPDGMRDHLKNEAEKNNRSLNAEIVARLEQTIKPQTEALPPITAEIFDQLFSRFDQLDKKIDKKNQD